MTQAGVVERMEIKHVSRVAGNLHPIFGPVEQLSPWAAVRGGYVSSRREGADQMLVLILYWWQLLPYPGC
jgi:hypothetical protein